MSDLHVTTNGATPPESVTSDRVTTPKRDRAAYMRKYRARQNGNNPPQEIKSNNQPNNNTEPNNPEPEQTGFEDFIEHVQKVGDKIAEPKPETKAEPQESEATRRLKDQLAALERGGELQRQQQAQAEQINRANQLFNIWRQEGLDDNGAQFLIAAGPQLITELTDFVSREALGQGHKINTPEYADALRKGFHTHLRHLQDQARQHAVAQQPPEATPAMEQIPPAPPLLDPLPAPRQQRSGRNSIVSAPVSRETPGTRAYDAEHDPRRMTLSPQEAEAARISGVSPAEYARQKLKYQQAKRDGLVD